MTIRNGYEVSSEGAVQHWEFGFARLDNATPTPTEPAKVLSAVIGNDITGTVLTTDVISVPNVAVIDVTHSMVYRHNIRNVITYGGGFEVAWRVLNEGDPVYYDNSATMPADYYLSTSPLNNLGAANPLFGFAVAADEAERALYPLGIAIAPGSSLPDVSVMQRGA